MGETATDWEGVALSLLRETGLDDPPQDAFALAHACGLQLVAGGRQHGCLGADGRLHYPGSVRRTRQHGVISHELGHWALRWAGEADGEVAASYVGGALMLPRRAFDRDLATTGWDLEQLRAKHINCSAEMIARRLVQLRDAVASIFDGGRLRLRVASPWLGDRYKRVSAWERELVDECMQTGERQGDGLTSAWPVFDGDHRRVVLLAETEQLSLRLQAASRA